MKNISNRPFYDPIFNCKVMDKMFPLINAPSALENEKFKQAYTLHTKNLELILNEAVVPESLEEDILYILELYSKSRDEGILYVEAIISTSGGQHYAAVKVKR